MPELGAHQDRPPLRFKADWGGANLTRAAGWLAQWVYEHTDDHWPSVIYTGRGMGDNLRALGAGEVDVALATPASFARLAVEGKRPFEGRPVPGLVAIAALPHRDAMLPVVRSDLGLTSLTNVAAYSGPLRVSLGCNDPDGFMGFGGDAVLAAGGVSLDTIVSRGGIVVRHEQPFDAVNDLREGRADLIVSEAIMTADWQVLAEERDITFLSLSPEEATALKVGWGLGTIDIPAGYFPRVQQPIRALDYSDWILATTRELPDDVAGLLARAIVEDGETFARGYRHLPVDYSPLRYPIDYRLARSTALELHSAAAIEYQKADRGQGAGSVMRSGSAGPRGTPVSPVSRVIEACGALAAAGQQDMAWGHVAVRDPDGRGVWLKRSGTGFDELTSADIHLLGWDGIRVEGTGQVHLECHIHLEIMKVRPDVMTSVHTHPSAVNAFCALDEPLRALSHEGVLFADPQLPRSRLSGDLVSNPARGAALARALGDARACLMPRHGLVAVGTTDAEAVMHAVLLEAACAVHLRAASAGTIRSLSDADEIRAKAQHVWPAGQIQSGYDFLVRRAARRR